MKLVSSDEIYFSNTAEDVYYWSFHFTLSLLSHSLPSVEVVVACCPRCHLVSSSISACSQFCAMLPSLTKMKRCIFFSRVHLISNRFTLYYVILLADKLCLRHTKIIRYLIF